MTITFENDSDVIIYGLEKILSFAKENQYLFVANCVWWLAGITGLDSGLTRHIDNLHLQGQAHLKESASEPGTLVRSVSTTPRDLTEDQRLDQVLERAEQVVQDSIRDRTARKPGRVNPLPDTKEQLKNVRKLKLKRRQRKNRKPEAKRNERLTKK